MKKQIYYIVLILFILFITGCEEFLEEKPVAQETIDSFLNDPNSPMEENFEKMMLATYSVFTISERSWQQNRHYYENMIPNFLSDDNQKGGNGASDFPEMLEMCTWSNIPSPTTSAHFETPWLVGYLGVSRANSVLSLLEENKGALTANSYNRMKGECLFIRGYFYFLLAKTFGGVPYFDKPITPDLYYDQPKVAPAELYQLIVDDLTEAIDLVPEKDGFAPVWWGGRATKSAVRAILARVYTMEIGFGFNSRTWNDVYTQTSAIISAGNYSLLPNYAQVFEYEGEMGSESVFEIPCYDVGQGYGGSGGYMEGRLVTPRVNATLTYGPNYQTAAGWGFSTPTQNLRDEFDPGDPRRECTMIADGDIYLGEVTPVISDGDCPSGYWQKKYAGHVVRHNTSGDENWRIVRYSEVLLMHAEASYHTGVIAEAISNLKEVRDRAIASTGPLGSVLGDMNAYPPAAGTLAAIDETLTGQALLDAIKHERRVELACEGLRYYDLVRWGEYEDAIRVKIPEDFFLKGENPENVVANYRSHLIDGIVPCLPIPSDESESFRIEQNPGY